MDGPTGVEVCGRFATAFGSDSTELWFPETHAGILREFLFRCAVLDPCVLVHTELLLRNPYRAEISFRDYELRTRLAAAGTFANAPESLLRHRVRDRQMHTAEKQAFGADFRRLRFQHFQALFPTHPVSDYITLARISADPPALNVTMLDHAGRWLVDLARGPDRWLRQAMIRRWLRACALSSALGPEFDSLRARHLAIMQDPARHWAPA